MWFDNADLGTPQDAKKKCEILQGHVQNKARNDCLVFGFESCGDYEAWCCAICWLCTAVMPSKNESAGKGELAVKKSRNPEMWRGGGGEEQLANVKKESGSVPALVRNCPARVHPPNLEGSWEFFPDAGGLSEEAAGRRRQLLVGGRAVREVQHLI